MNSDVRRWCVADPPGPHFLDAPEQPVLLIESRAAFTRRRFHRRKAHLVLVRSIPDVEVFPTRGFCTDRETFNALADGHHMLKLENREPAPTRTSLSGSDASAATARDARG